MASISVSWSHSSAALSAWLDSRTGEKVRVTLTFFKSSGGPPLFPLSVVAERTQGVLVSDMLSSSTRDASNLDEKLPVSAKCCGEGGGAKQGADTSGRDTQAVSDRAAVRQLALPQGHATQCYSARNAQVWWRIPMLLLGA